MSCHLTLERLIICVRCERQKGGGAWLLGVVQIFSDNIAVFRSIKRQNMFRLKRQMNKVYQCLCY